MVKDDDEFFDILQEQINTLTVTDRTFTGSGFYTTFSCESNITKLPTVHSYHVGNIGAKIEGLKHDAGFYLHIKNGVIDQLEGFSYEGRWPKDLKVINVFYENGDCPSVITDSGANII